MMSPDLRNRRTGWTGDVLRTRPHTHYRCRFTISDGTLPELSRDPEVTPRQCGTMNCCSVHEISQRLGSTDPHSHRGVLWESQSGCHEKSWVSLTDLIRTCLSTREVKFHVTDLLWLRLPWPQTSLPQSNPQIWPCTACTCRLSCWVHEQVFVHSFRVCAFQLDPRWRVHIMVRRSRLEVVVQVHF